MKSYDLIVCGGGPAGVCAAIRAARDGVSVLLVEKNGCLGGVWTSGMVSWLLDLEGKWGIIKEITERVSACGHGRFARGGNFLCEPEYVKYLLEKMCREAGVEIRLYTYITGTCVVDRKIHAVCTHSKSGKEQFAAKYIIDATGDGDVGYLAGCQYEIGLENGAFQQPLSLFALVNGLKYEDMRPYDNGAECLEGISPKQLLFEAMTRTGIQPSQTVPAMYYLSNDLYLLTMVHEYGCRADDAEALTKATLHAREEIHRMVAGLKKLGGIWKNICVVATAESIGVRDGRRIKGVAVVSKEDVLESKRCTDEVCLVHFPMDVHAISEEEKTGYSFVGRTQGYSIPAGALIAADIDNLFLAGRCISGDFYAHSSYRVTGNAAVIGEKAGEMATYCLQKSVLSSREILIL